MEKPKIAQIEWLLKKRENKIQSIGFVRDHHNGFYVINESSGSYYSGHSESWKKKWEEYVNSGYITESQAKEKGLVDSRWSPPKIKNNDQDIIEKIVSGVL